MYRFLALCLILGLSTLRAEAYDCKGTSEHRNLSKEWNEVATQYCDKLDDTQSDNIVECINATKTPLMDAIKQCQMDFNQPSVTFVGFLRNVCQPDYDMKDYFCCLTDYLRLARADKQSVDRSSVYTECLDEYLTKSS